MMIGMTIDVVENSAWALRTAALGALVFDVLDVVNRLLQGLGPDDHTGGDLCLQRRAPVGIAGHCSVTRTLATCDAVEQGGTALIPPVESMWTPFCTRTQRSRLFTARRVNSCIGTRSH
jgi:hypothetical protein